MEATAKIDITPGRMLMFMTHVMSDMSGVFVSLLCAIGDRLGLFADLADHGPATTDEFADRTGLHQAYAREWLSALTCAGYLEYDAVTQRFALPPEHALVLAEPGPMYLGGGFQLLLGLLRPHRDLLEDFREGRGVDQGAYGDDLLEGMQRMSDTWFDHLLVNQWLPSVPDVEACLRAGARVADVGCGSGRALLNLARAFPHSRFTGYDVFGPAVERASAHARADDLADRVLFEQRDVARGLPGRYDLITAFDALHDFTDLDAALRALRQALDPEGTLLVLETNCHEDLAEQTGPVGAILYGTSTLYSVPVSLAKGGRGAGAMSLTEDALRTSCRQAGFRRFRRLPTFENPFNVLYAVQP